ncbi:MAG: DUF362 domain-containing protein [Nitrospirae bacterium]|nr:DUF362 domain-containing protein [Nitrospirota bacterium]
MDKPKSNVYFSSLKNSKMTSPLEKISRLFERCAPSKMFSKGDLIAIKVHFGELGNTSFLRPIFLRPIIETLKSLETKPFLTDTNTLYIGMRTNSVDHFHNAMLNGFGYSTLQVPVIIADGLRGEQSVSIQVSQELLESVSIASEIAHSDGMVVVSHFKGHEVSGFGGAIKNMSMGCASRQGKLQMHSVTRPVVDVSICSACGKCQDNCQSKAIDIEKTAFISTRCVGCSRCIAVCPEKAIGHNWDESASNIQKKMIEYASGTIKALNSRLIFINILTSISPACDCYKGNDAPITGDLGFMASLDPIAIDRASYEMVINSTPHKSDPFREIYDYLDPEVQFRHAKKIGLGNADYNLIDIDLQ